MARQVHISEEEDETNRKSKKTVSVPFPLVWEIYRYVCDRCRSNKERRLLKGIESIVNFNRADTIAVGYRIRGMATDDVNIPKQVKIRYKRQRQAETREQVVCLE